MEVKEPENIQTYSKHYNEKSFWKKLKGAAGKMGRKTTYYALVLFYTLQSPSVNLGNKAIICGALGYLILPLDVIPDLTPVLGFADDAAALAAAYQTVKASITPDIEQKVNAKLDEWFGKAEE